jgi:hypothetical protein
MDNSAGTIRPSVGKEKVHCMVMLLKTKGRSGEFNNSNPR